MKCFFCGKDIEKTFLDKFNGTIVKIKEGDKNILHYVCSQCQKKHKNLKDEISKK